VIESPSWNELKTVRVYDTSVESGYRILVDRLWPRGVSKEDAKLDLWLKEIGPSNELRKWFGHDPERWNGFKEKFFSEQDEKKELVKQIIVKAREGDVVLLFCAKDEEHNNAVALKEYIESRMGIVNPTSVQQNLWPGFPIVLH
jgi:uncharacterized protein YeaO (DUF488 family)